MWEVQGLLTLEFWINKLLECGWDGRPEGGPG